MVIGSDREYLTIEKLARQVLVWSFNFTMRVIDSAKFVVLVKIQPSLLFPAVQFQLFNEFDITD